MERKGWVGVARGASVIHQYRIEGSLGFSTNAISLKASDILHVNAHRIGYQLALLAYQEKRS